MQLNDGRVIPNFMKQALRGEDLTVYGDGSQTRSFCYVSDEIEGFLRLSHATEHLPVNIGNPTEFTILECARQVLAVTAPRARSATKPCPRMIPSSVAPTSPKPELYSAENRKPTSRPACSYLSTISARPLCSDQL